MDAETAYNHIRSKFIPLRETRALIKTHKLKIKYGHLSEGESSTIKTILTQFLKDRHLKMKDLRNYLIEESEFPMHDLLYECTQACELRTYKSVHTHIMYMYNPFIHDTIWGEDKDLQLLDLVNQKGFKWKEISYHLSKFKDLCLARYRRLKGELSKNLSKNWIESLLENMPVTDEEWAVLCKETKLNKVQISRAVEKHLNGKQLQVPKCHVKEIELCLRILNNNHFCKFHVSIEHIISFLDSDPLNYGIVDKIDGNTTPFISVRGLSRNKGNEVGTTPIDDTADESDDEFESMVENMAKAQSENRSQTKFLSRFLDFFKLDPSFNLNITINKDDIFWLNITREMVITKSEAFAKYNSLARRYDWNVFKDIYDTVMKLSYDYVMLKTKQALLDSKQLIDTPLDTNEVINLENTGGFKEANGNMPELASEPYCNVPEDAVLINEEIIKNDNLISTSEIKLIEEDEKEKSAWPIFDKLINDNYLDIQEELECDDAAMRFLLEDNLSLVNIQEDSGFKKVKKSKKHHSGKSNN